MNILQVRCEITQEPDRKGVDMREEPRGEEDKEQEGGAVRSMEKTHLQCEVRVGNHCPGAY